MRSFIVFAFFFAHSAWAVETIKLPNVNFVINTNNAYEKFSDTLKNPEGFLKRYKPEGATISNKSISHNEIRFDATKTILFISKTVHVEGVIDVIENKRCKATEASHLLSLTLDGSDWLVLDNVNKIEVQICTVTISKNQISVTVLPTLIKGQDYNEIIGSIAIDVLKAQINPLLNAVIEEVKK